MIPVSYLLETGCSPLFVGIAGQAGGRGGLLDAAMRGSAQGQRLMRQHGPWRQLPMEKEPDSPRPGQSLACEALVS